jgi:hypothetical protein
VSTCYIQSKQRIGFSSFFIGCLRLNILSGGFYFFEGAMNADVNKISHSYGGKMDEKQREGLS